VEFRRAGLCAPPLAAVFVAALAPRVALADAYPNNHGHHYHHGWVHHHSPPSRTHPAPAPGPSGGGKTTGPKNTIVAVMPAALTPQAPTVIPPETPVLAPAGRIVTTAEPVDVGRDLWLVAIILATVLAGAVTLGVLTVGRGGHYAIRRTLAPIGIKF
jgi:hypothetical protein